MSEKIIWRGTKPIVIGTADDDGNPLETVTIHPGEEIPEKWMSAYRDASQRVHVGQDDPLNMSNVKLAYQKLKGE